MSKDPVFSRRRVARTFLDAAALLSPGVVAPHSPVYKPARESHSRACIPSSFFADSRSPSHSEGRRLIEPTGIHATIEKKKARRNGEFDSREFTRSRILVFSLGERSVVRPRERATLSSHAAVSQRAGNIQSGNQNRKESAVVFAE